MDANDQQASPMDTQLKRWAQSRRDAAGDAFDLSEFGRQQLQEEVRKAHAPPEPPAREAGRPLWLSLLPRLAAAGGLAAVMFFVLTHMGSRLGPAGPMQLAKQDQRAGIALEAPAPVSAGQSPAPAPTAASDHLQPLTAPTSERPQPAAPKPTDRSLELAEPVTDAGIKARTGAADRSSLALRAPDEALNQPTDAYRAPVTFAAAEVTNTPEVRAPAAGQPRAVRYGNNTQTRLRPEPTAVAPAPAPVAGHVALQPAEAQLASESEADAGDYVALGRYGPAQVRRRNLNSPPQTVLMQFRLERAGGRVRVTDADGSVYAGSIAAQPTAATDGEAGFEFEVRGRRRESGEAVVFRGAWLGGPRAAVRGTATVGEGSRQVVDAARLPE